jgi:nucleoside-diphosphate-sugar epimerase
LTVSWLVTGAGGFIGARLCRLLDARGETFVGLLRPGEPAPPAPGAASWPAGRFRVVDLRDAPALAACVAELRPRYVVNLAAVGVAPAGAEPLDEFVRLNVLVPGLLSAAMPRDAVLVQAGSMSQYADVPGPLAEATAPLADPTLYAWSKNAAESLLSTLERTAPGTAVIRARLFGITGPGEAPHRLLPSIVAGRRSGRPIDLSDGLQVRDVLHVDDVAAALAHLAGATALYGRAVNVGRGAGRTVRWIAERAAARLGCGGLLRFGALARRTGEAAERVADVSLLAGSGFAPARDFERTVDDTVDQLVAAGGAGGAAGSAAG